MTKQTLAEKLRILADAADAGYRFVTADGMEIPLEVVATDMQGFSKIVSTPPKPPTIKVGKREINAPLRVMPKHGDVYWWVDNDALTECYTWKADAIDVSIFNAANCWATKEDAEAYAAAALAVRKGEA